MIPRPGLRALLAGLALAALLSWPSVAAEIDWTRYAEERTVEVVTENEDGSSRETTIWLAVVGGEGFIRTGGSRWGHNVERKPAIVLRVAGEELPVRADFVEDEATRKQVTDAMREKYGLMDLLITPIRGSRPMIMRLRPR